MRGLLVKLVVHKSEAVLVLQRAVHILFVLFDFETRVFVYIYDIWCP